MMGAIRRLGIAFGSLVIAWLAVSISVGIWLGPWAGLVAVVLGGLIYRDILRRERRAG